MNLKETYKKILSFFSQTPFHAIKYLNALRRTMAETSRPSFKKPTRLSPPQKGVLGVTGIDIMGGQIQDEELGNLELLADRCPIYDEMEKQEGSVRLSLLCYKKPICSAKWDETIEKEAEINDKLREDMLDYSKRLIRFNPFFAWKSKLNEICDYQKYGVSVFEVESEPIDNQWFLKGLWYRHPKTIQWQFDNENNLIGIEQQDYQGNKQAKPISRDKLIIFNYEKKGDNWDGIGMCRYQYRPYMLIKKILKNILIGLERYLVAEPRIQAPQGVGIRGNEWETVKSMLSDIRSGAQTGALYPHGWVDITKEMSMAGFDTALKIIESLKKDIFWGAMTQHAMLAGGAAGSWALSKDATDFFGMAIQAELDLIAGELNKLIKYYIDLNFTTDVYPVLNAIISEEDMHQWLLDTILTFEKQVLPPYPSAQDMIIQRLGLPEENMAKFQEEQQARQDEIAQQQLELENAKGDKNKDDEEDEGEDEKPGNEDKKKPEDEDDEPPKNKPPGNKPPGSKATKKAERASHHKCGEDTNPFWRDLTDREKAIGGIKYFKEKQKFMKDQEAKLNKALTPIITKQMDAILTYSKSHDIKQLMDMEVPNEEKFRSVAERFLQSSMQEGLDAVLSEGKKRGKTVPTKTVAETKKQIAEISRQKSYIVQGKYMQDMKVFIADNIVNNTAFVGDEPKAKEKTAAQLVNMAMTRIIDEIGVKGQV